MTRNRATNFFHGLAGALLALTLSAAAAAPAQAQDPERLVERSRNAYLRVMTDAEKQIPYTVLRRAIAVGIFPRVTKAGFVVGGTGGSGVILARRGDGWTGPSFHRISAASVGAQIGAQRAAVFLLIMNRRALNQIMREETTLSGDAAAVAGPDSASASDVDLERAGIISYWRAEGAFLGAALEGAEISQLHDETRIYWGRDMTAETILVNPPAMNVPDSGRLLRRFMIHSPERNLIGAVQMELAQRGYYRSAVDGVPGSGTRRAVESYQQANNLPVDGRATQPLLDHMRAQEE